MPQKLKRFGAVIVGLMAGAILVPTIASAQYPVPYGAYPGRFGRPADVRFLVSPKQAEVYVDGYYIGIADDFSGYFHRFHVRPGEHEVVLHLAGYRTVSQKINPTPDSTYKFHYTMEKLAPGEASEPPPLPPVASSGPGQRPQPGAPPFMGAPLPGGPGFPGAPGYGPPPVPRMPPPPPLRPGQVPLGAGATSGTLVIRVQPADAEVLIDGERWSGPAGDDRLVVQVSAGSHHVEVQKSGYRRFATDVPVQPGQSMPLNVSLSPER